jgi:hypothetical protein
MPKKYQENTGNSPLWVNGVLIPPGEGREVEVADDAPPQVEEAPVDADAPLRELLEGNVAAVTAALEGLGMDTLKRLGELESEGKDRKGVLEALANAQIKLADAALVSDTL